MSKEAMKLALEALKELVAQTEARLFAVKHDHVALQNAREAITAIKQARALDKKAENARELGLDYEPVLKDNSNYRYDPPIAEPVAYLCENAVGHKYFRWKKPSSEFKPIALYTTPPAAQRQWVGLTDEEKRQIFEREDYQGWLDYINAIEAKLKEKNNG